MSNPNNFTKFRILSLIAASLLLLWFFFDVDLSKSVLLKDLGLSNPKILKYVLVALLFFFLLESVLEYKKEVHTEGWPSSIQFIFVVMFSIGSLLISYPKLITNTFLDGTSRKDIIIPIITATISSIGAINLRIGIEFSLVFYKFRKTILRAEWIKLIIFGFISILGILILLLTSSGCRQIVLSTRFIIFTISFISIFFTFVPKKKLFDEQKLAKLSRMSDWLDREVELSEQASSMGLKRPKSKKRLHKYVMKQMEQAKERENNNLKTRFVFLKDLKFRSVGDHVEIQYMDDEEEFLRTMIMSKDEKKIVKTVDIKFKYFRTALENAKQSMPKNEDEFKNLLNIIGFKAYELQVLSEDDPNVLLYELASNGELDKIKQLVNKRNPNINYRFPDGWTSLLIAVANGHVEIVNYFLQKAADPNISNRLGMSSLSFASWYGKEPICRILINYGANVNHKNMDGLTPLMIAALNGHPGWPPENPPPVAGSKSPTPRSAEQVLS